MPDQTQSSIRIAAPAAEVMRVIADFPAYPDWTGEVKSAVVVESGPDGRADVVRFVIDAGVLKDEYSLRYEWAGNERVTWSLVDGKVLTELDGSYALSEDGLGSTEVVYRLSVGLALPMLGMMKRRAERVIIDRALSGLKKHIEGESS